MVKLTKKRFKYLNGMGVSQIKIRIREMQSLLDHYTGKKTVRHCPICQTHCSQCVWYIIFNEHCGDYFLKHIAENVNISYARENIKAYPEWTKLRIKQLKEWIALYERFLKKINKIVL